MITILLAAFLRPILWRTHSEVFRLEARDAAVGFAGLLKSIDGDVNVLEVFHHLVDEVEDFEGGVLKGKALSHSFLRVQRSKVAV